MIPCDLTFHALGRNAATTRWMATRSRQHVYHVAAVAILCAWALLSVTPVAGQIEFNRDIRPVLSQHCLACHGTDEGSREADLRLDTFDGATTDLGGYAAIVPGDPAASEMVLRIADDDAPMPPDGHKRLSANEIQLLRSWIEQGAVYETHWAFVAPVRPAVPHSPEDAWSRNAIDRLVLQQLNERGMTPQSDADPVRLIRRVALDLTGLPPRPDQVERFVATPDDATYETIVDELLNDPAYGEHWAAMWLDLARYADTVGYAGDERRSIWPWRDWLILAINENMAFDQMTREMLAGDLLENSTPQQKLATAFHRNTLSNNEGGTNDEEFRTIAVKDRLSTTASTWLGLTMRCAECHSHKYDPVSQTEYYAFMDFFNQTADADRPDEAPVLEIAPFNHADQDEAEKVAVPVLAELPEAERRTTHVHHRGSFRDPRDPVAASTPAFLHGWPDGAPQNRLGLTEWLLADDNPLTSRVTVNRYWARLMGRGIVETEEDFGTQGTPPTHPQLLDWMAVDLRENGWDIKRLLRQIVTSSTYRQSAVASPKLLERDPDNRLLARGPRHRLSAEVVRDQALAISGLLSRRMYGPPVFPPNPIKTVQNAFKGVETWQTSEGEDRYRRAIYTYLKRSAPHPLFETFDVASRDVCNLRRIDTNTPLQSFMTLNGEMFVECAQALAGRMMKESASAEPDVRLTLGWQLALFQPPSTAELETLRQLYANALDQYQSDPQAAQSMAGALADSIDEASLSEAAALVVVANVILNLDAVLTD